MTDLSSELPHGPQLAFKRPARADLLSVVIPCAYDPAGLRNTLESLTACAEPEAAVEIIVANDGNDSSVSEVVAGFGYREVILARNQGPGAARNRAMEESSGSVIAMLDADIKVGPDWLVEVRRASRTAEYVGGRVQVDRGMVVSLGHQFDSLVEFDMQLALRQFHFSGSGNLAVHRRLIERVGGFDERLRSGQDAELGDRVYRHGATQVYWPTAVAFHPPRNLRQQWRKLRRALVGQTLRAEIWPDRFPPHRVHPARILRLLLPPRRTARLDADITEFGLMRVPLFVLIKWVWKIATIYHLLAIKARPAHLRTWGDFDFNQKGPKD